LSRALAVIRLEPVDALIVVKAGTDDLVEPVISILNTQTKAQFHISWLAKKATTGIKRQ